ncbi:hypothetical protein ACRVLY_002920 [Listeria monocytogenes]|uniref:hypothetical protein n=1 Tax=Listeria monocytogenes TaxID=1639 RepID=UPI000873DBC6|nr:hypothetical protein [Listeria monocytogenes]EAC3356839.1 hypothetical protein [Listeria monocytogenes]EAC7182502.1 hypothetical protein [Listeria monocytogenes]EAC8000875.1 hypothetical protein [Listeria monocytogenes]EAC8351033.1 hypothetical protein [Listeria monocytogenes]EAC9519258.1 hypothetical protein [Listeria monocytogenes]
MENFNTLELIAIHNALINYSTKLNNLATSPKDTSLEEEIAVTESAIQKATALFVWKTSNKNLFH